MLECQYEAKEGLDRSNYVTHNLLLEYFHNMGLLNDDDDDDDDDGGCGGGKDSFTNTFITTKVKVNAVAYSCVSCDFDSAE
jgi:hypothetical protein